MKKRIFTIAIMAVFAFSFVQAQDLNEILDTYFETIGQEKLLEATTVVSTGKMLQMGMEFDFKFIAKRPDKAYIEADIQGAVMKQGYDGTNGWMVAPWTGSVEPIDITGPELRGLEEMADMDGKLWNWEEKGHQLEFVGKEDLEGAEAFVLKLTDKNGNIDHYYIDAENYVIIKTVTKTIMEGAEVEVEVLMSNFQDIDGYIMPFTTVQQVGGQTGMTLNIEEVKYNVEVKDDIFVKPVVSDKPEEE